MKLSWRAAVAAFSAVALLGATACGSGESHSTDSAAKGVEVFTWWAEDGEKAALDAVTTVFSTECPDYKFINSAIEGGAGVPAKTVLSSRLQQGDPPDTFQVHAGVELADYVNANQIEDLTELSADWGLTEALSQELTNSVTVSGKIYAIPIGIHRTNVLWANTQVLAEAGITSNATTLEQFLVDLENLKARGVATPLAVGRDWTQLMLLEAVLITDLGPSAFSALWTDSSAWTEDKVAQAITDYEKLLSYSNRDRDNLDWTEAEQLLLDGQAAYQLMGDWEAADLEARNFQDYSSFVFPGNGTTFQWVADTFALPLGAKNAAGAQCWLRTVATEQAQKAFSVEKGSIPARTDVTASGYSTYQQSAISAWGWSTHVPSCAHGTICSQALQGAVNAAIGRFSTDLDIAGLQKAMATAVSQASTS